MCLVLLEGLSSLAGPLVASDCDGTSGTWSISWRLKGIQRLTHHPRGNLQRQDPSGKRCRHVCESIIQHEGVCTARSSSHYITRWEWIHNSTLLLLPQLRSLGLATQATIQLEYNNTANEWCNNLQFNLDWRYCRKNLVGFRSVASVWPWNPVTDFFGTVHNSFGFLAFLTASSQKIQGFGIRPGKYE